MSKKLLIIVFVLFAVLGGLGTKIYLSGEGDLNNRIDAFQKEYSLFLTPQQKFEKALETTGKLDTAHMEFTGNVTTTITNHNNGLSGSGVGKLAGYITGSTDGTISRMELRISGDSNPELEVIIGLITIDDGKTIYVSGPATKGLWQKYSKEEWDKLGEDTPTDASLFVFDIASTLFSKSNALLASANTSSLKQLASENGQDKYKVEISVPSYIGSQDSDEEYSDKEISESKIILKEAIISGEFLVDQTTSYVNKMHIEVKNMHNVPTEELTKMGVSAKYDATMDLNLSRYNIPTNISAPEESSILKPNVNQVKIKSLSDLQK